MKFLFRLIILFAASMPLVAQSQFSGGSGTKDDPYQIANEEDLRMVAKMVNEGQETFKGKYLKQTEDITFNTVIPVEPIGGPNESGFKHPDEKSFQGTYDGGMKKIYNLNLYNAKELDGGEASHMGVGLFGNITNGAVVKNVVVASGEIYAFSHVGTIVASMGENTAVEHCKVGPNVRVHTWSSGAGVVGGSSGKNISIKQCANYANVFVYGSGNYKNAGGIIASSGEAKIQGCANFGDIWGYGGFAGGIIGYFPLSNDNFTYSHPTIESCMNAGDVSSVEPVAAGIIGAHGYNIKNENGSHRPHTAIKNSYSYGQSWVGYTKTNGPIIGFFFKDHGLSVEKTFYNKDRYVMTEDKKKIDSEIAFSHGVAKSHSEMTSQAFLNELNQGSAFPFEADKYKINGNMPVLKWINDSYDAEIDKPNQYRKDITHTLYKRPAGTFFRPNRAGEFLIYNMSMHMPDIQSKSFGVSLDRAWIDRKISIKDNKVYTFFMSSSAFRRPVLEDGSYQNPRQPQTADHWLITPEFTVEEGKTWFHWEAASEDSDIRCGYELYVADASADHPDKYKDLTPIFKTEAEEPAQAKTEKDKEGKDRTYYSFTHRKVDLKDHVGKKVRLAFRDNNTNKFFLMIGKFAMGESNYQSAEPIVWTSQVAVEGSTIVATSTGVQQIAIYGLDGSLLASAQGELRYEATAGVYLVRVADTLGYEEVRKVIVD